MLEVREWDSFGSDGHGIRTLFKAADIMKAKKKEKDEKKEKNGNDEDKEDEDSKDEDAAETNHEDGNEAAAIVPDLKSEGDQKPKPEEAKSSEKSGEKNGLSQKTAEEPKGETNLNHVSRLVFRTRLCR